MAWPESPLATFDTETTGTDPTTARIVSAHLALIAGNGTVLVERSWLVDPGVPIPKEASDVHGITADTLAAAGGAALDPGEALPWIAAALSSRLRPVVIMNAPYDLTVLRCELARHGYPDAPFQPRFVLDPLVLDKAMDRYRRGKRTLTALAARYGVPLTGAHDAAADAVAAAGVARAIGRTYPMLGGTDVETLQGMQARWHAEQAASLRDYFQRAGKAEAAASVDESWPVR